MSKEKETRNLPTISTPSFDLIPVEEAVQVFEQCSDRLIEAQKADDLDGCRAIMISRPYRVALFGLIQKGKVGKVLIDSMDVSIATARKGVALSVTAKKLGRRVVVALLSKILDELFGDKLSSVDKATIAISFLERAPFYSLEEFIRVVSWGKMGKLGKVFALRVDTFNEWLTVYDQLMDDKMAELAVKDTPPPDRERGSVFPAGSLEDQMNKAMEGNERIIKAKGWEKWKDDRFPKEDKNKK